MYNLSGLIYRIYATGGIMLLIGLLLLIFSQFWNPKKRSTKKGKSELWTAILIIVFSCIFIATDVYDAVCPTIVTYEGAFVRENRNSRVAPPLPLTMEYVLQNPADEKKSVFYLDVLSKKEIYPEEFEKDVWYRFYYEESSRIIVKVERLPSDR